jgi:cellulose biosynthesis protein BcsQ
VEVVIYSSLDGLQAQLDPIRDLSVLAPSRAEQVQRLLSGERPPQAFYLDDTRSASVPELWRLVQAAQAAQVRVLVNATGGTAAALLNDARAVGIPTLSSRDATEVSHWIAENLGVEARSEAGALPVLAVGAAKGGIGKTFATCVLAEGFRRRGLNVLVWDSDISNPGLVPAFRIPSSAPSYLHLVQRGPAHWNPTGVQPFIFHPDHTAATANGWGRIDFLIGSHTVAKAENDVRLPDWQGLYRGVTQLPGYDLVLIDTPPDYLRRPYATHALQSGGFVVLPCPPGARERMGVAHMLDHFRDHIPERLDACMLLFMEPEKGVTTSVKDILPMFAGRYPQVQALGTLPRSPRLASLADEHDGYISMLDLGAKTAFAQAAHRIVDSLIVQIGLTPTLPMPKLGWWDTLKARMGGAPIQVPPANTSVGSLARGDA